MQEFEDVLSAEEVAVFEPRPDLWVSPVWSIEDLGAAFRLSRTEAEEMVRDVPPSIMIRTPGGVRFKARETLRYFGVRT